MRFDASNGRLFGQQVEARSSEVTRPYASVIATVERIAKSNCTVLVTGESGTGKELVVAALHDASPRSKGPLVAVNCGAIPENLIESELFGHARGAFTGAHAARQGRVAAAEGGTLFLDEIGDLPVTVQVKILRLLQQREYSAVGDSRTVHCDIRIVAATHKDLEQEVVAGRFREDLYYRLNVIHVPVPALRERASDIPVLAQHFFEECAARSGRDDLDGFSEEALTAIAAFDWPGNVRALRTQSSARFCWPQDRQSSFETCRLAFGARLPSGLPVPTSALPTDGIDLRAAVEQYENDLIRQALFKTGRNKNRAAQLLGLNRTTLVEESSSAAGGCDVSLKHDNAQAPLARPRD